MGKITIEYCGGWGYKGPANKLKGALAVQFPNVEIDCFSAGSRTSKI